MKKYIFGAILLLLVLALFIFRDPLLQKGANYALGRVNDMFIVSISSLDTDLIPLNARFKLQVKEKKTSDVVVKAEKLSVDIRFRKFKPIADILVADLNIKTSKQDLERMGRQNTKKEPQEKKDSNLLSYLGKIDVRNIHFSFMDETSNNRLTSQVLSLSFDFPEGKGKVEGISAQLPELDTRVAEVKEIRADFHTPGLLGKENSDLKVTFEDIKITFAASILKALRELAPESEKPKESSPDQFLGELSEVTLEDVAVTWPSQKNIFKLGKLTTTQGTGSSEEPSFNIIMTDFDFWLSKKLQRALKTEETKPSGDKPDIPFSINRLLVGNGKVHFLGYPGIGQQDNLTLTGIFGHLNHLTLEPRTPLASFNFNATFEGDARIIAKGKLDFSSTTPQWSLDYRLFDLDMRKLNDELRARLPLTFREGKFDLYGEAIKKKKNTIGYVSLFLDDASYLGNRKEFKNVSHIFNEVAATVANWTLENKRTETVATRIPFVLKEGNLDLDTGAAVWNAIDHGLLETDRVRPRGNKYMLEAQEEKPK